MTNSRGYFDHTIKAPFRRAARRGLERLEQAALTEAAMMEWWAEGYRHHKAERENALEAKRGKGEGVRPGWPDVTLHIPRAPKQWLNPGYGTPRPPVLAALELKALVHRPTREPEHEWWLSWKPEIDPLAKNEPTKFGLRWSQARTLQNLAGTEVYRTKVAYGWEEAIEWLREVAGHRPEVLPEGW